MVASSIGEEKRLPHRMRLRSDVNGSLMVTLGGNVWMASLAVSGASHGREVDRQRAGVYQHNRNRAGRAECSARFRRDSESREAAAHQDSRFAAHMCESTSRAGRSPSRGHRRFSATAKSASPSTSTDTSFQPLRMTPQTGWTQRFAAEKMRGPTSATSVGCQLGCLSGRKW